MKRINFILWAITLLVFHKGVMTIFDHLAQTKMTTHGSGLFHLMLLPGHFILNRLSERPLVYTCMLAVLLFCLRAWYLLRRPLDYVEVVSNLETDQLTNGSKRKGRRRSSRNADVQYRDREGYPPVFPNGWIPILESRLLAEGEVKPISTLGEELAVYRSQSGEVYVVDAFCPHLGAHLGFGSKISGSCIECPFHGWKFDGATGNCVDIPYSSNKIPSLSNLKTWRSCEINNVIFVWYHAEGEEPSWTIPEIPEVNKGHWTYRGRTEHIINCHIQDVGENGADGAHFEVLHVPSMLAGGKSWQLHGQRARINDHSWNVRWLEGPQSHEATIFIRHDLKVLRYNLPILGFDVKISQLGPALAQFHLDSWWGQAAYVQTVTPLGPLKHRFVHMFYAEPKMPNFLSRVFLYGAALMLQRDIAIWKTKCFIRNPIYVVEDKSISRYRRWYSQFYSEHSPTLKTIRAKTLDW